jgi:hypothetical protein
MKKKYTWIRIDSEAKKELDDRLKKINNIDLKNIGIQNKQIRQIDLTKFLFKNRIFISDKELKQMAKKKFGAKFR